MTNSQHPRRAGKISRRGRGKNIPMSLERAVEVSQVDKEKAGNSRYRELHVYGGKIMLPPKMSMS